MIKAVLFDCFGVLCVGARSYVVSQCDESVRDRVDELFDQADYGFLTTDEFVEQAAELMGISADAFRDMLRHQYARDTAMTDFVRKLRAHYTVGLLTNANNTVIGQLFTQQELDELFDIIVVSSAVGMVKPSPEFYEYAVGLLGLAPDECVMIDDIERNIVGAREVGLQGVVFTSQEQCEQALKELGVNA